MGKWYENQKKPTNNFRKLLQERIEKSNSFCKLTAEGERWLSNFERILAKIKVWRKSAKPSSANLD